MTYCICPFLYKFTVRYADDTGEIVQEYQDLDAFKRNIRSTINFIIAISGDKCLGIIS